MIAKDVGDFYYEMNRGDATKESHMKYFLDDAQRNAHKSL